MRLQTDFLENSFRTFSYAIIYILSKEFFKWVFKIIRYNLKKREMIRLAIWRKGITFLVIVRNIGGAMLWVCRTVAQFSL